MLLSVPFWGGCRSTSPSTSSIALGHNYEGHNFICHNYICHRSAVDRRVWRFWLFLFYFLGCRSTSPSTSSTASSATCHRPRPLSPTSWSDHRGHNYIRPSLYRAITICGHNYIPDELVRHRGPEPCTPQLCGPWPYRARPCRP